MRQLLSALALGMVGCSNSADPVPPGAAEAAATIKAMQAKQAEHRRILDDLARQIAASEAKAQDAKLESEFQECRATKSQIEAEVSVREAACASQVAGSQLCRADNAKKAAEHSILGCLGGIGIAALSGGSAAPWALGGCGAGYLSGKASEEQCEQPTCTGDRASIEASVMADRGLSERMKCGGDAGFEVGPHMKPSRGVVVQAVGARTIAHGAGVAAGDAIIEVNGMPLESCSDISQERWLRTTDGAQSSAAVAVKFVRNGVAYQGESPLLKRDSKGRLSKAPQLGATCAGVADVEYQAGTVITSVAPSGAAERAGVRAGDVVVAARAVDAELAGGVPSGALLPHQTSQVLDHVRAGRAIRLTVERGPKMLDVELVLASRCRP